MALTVTEDGFTTSSPVNLRERAAHFESVVKTVDTTGRTASRNGQSRANSDVSSSLGQVNQVKQQTGVFSSGTGFLKVVTGDDPDRIELRRDTASNDFILTVNGKTSSYSDIDLIHIHTYGGDDVVTTLGASWSGGVVPFLAQDGPNIYARVDVKAGDGNDIVDLSAVTVDDTHIEGGDGRDFLAGGHPSCGSDSQRRDFITPDGRPLDLAHNADVILTHPDSEKQQTYISWDSLDMVVGLPRFVRCNPEPGQRKWPD